LILSCN